MTLAHIVHRSPMTESTMYEPDLMTVSRPMRVAPLSVTFGSSVTSSSISTVASMNVELGCWTVTPACMWASRIRA